MKLLLHKFQKTGFGLLLLAVLIVCVMMIGEVVIKVGLWPMSVAAVLLFAAVLLLCLSSENTEAACISNERKFICLILLLVYLVAHSLSLLNCMENKTLQVVLHTLSDVNALALMYILLLKTHIFRKSSQSQCQLVGELISLKAVSVCFVYAAFVTLLRNIYNGSLFDNLDGSVISVLKLMGNPFVVVGLYILIRLVLYSKRTDD